MRHKNSCSLIGTVGKDAEVRQTQGGVQYARFSLATSSGGYQKQDGSQVPEKTEWHSITAWRQLAEFCGKYVRKGMKVDVEGMITYSKFTDQQGIERTQTEIVASDIVLMSMPKEQQAAPQVQQGRNQMQPPPQLQYGGGGYQGGQPQPQNGQGGGYQPRPQYNPQGQTQQFPPNVNAQGQPVYQNQGGGYQPQPQPQGGAPGADDLPF